MKAPPHISPTALALAVASASVFVCGAASLLATAFWRPSVSLPLGIGGIVGAWWLFEQSMRRIARDNGIDVTG